MEGVPSWFADLLTEDARRTVEEQLRREADAVAEAERGGVDIGLRVNRRLPHEFMRLSERTIKPPSRLYHDPVDYYHDRDILFGILVYGFKVVVGDDALQALPTVIVCPTGYVTLKRRGIFRRALDLYDSGFYPGPTCYEDDNYMDVRWFTAVACVRKREINSYLEELRQRCGLARIIY